MATIMSDMDGQQDNRSRLEREIEEILDRADAPIPITAKARSTKWRLRRTINDLTTRSRRIRMVDSFWGWILIAAAVYVVGAAITDQHGLAWQVVRVVGVIGLGMAIYRIARPTNRSQRKIWRGQVQDMGRPGVQLGDRFDEWKRRR
jgi:hypothetical protein